ncbi:MAG TPA: DinB family protein [Thermoanaerobaculia bacterium]|nr:DinB family protein [Thermoanaerobaculia bacterium]
MTSLPPPLVSLIAQFESASAEANALASAAGDELFARRPGPQRWSAADCLAHLTATNERYLKYLERIIAEAKPAANPRYKPTLVGRIFKAQMEPGRRFRFRAPKVFVPPSESGPRAEVLAAFQNSQQRMARAIESAAALDFSRVTMRSPASRFVKLNLWDAFQALAAHERRHLLQARRAIDADLSSRA